MRLQVLSNKRIPIKTQTFNMDGQLEEANQQIKYWRWEERGKIGDGFRTFMVFADNLTQQMYIEEMDGGNLKFVENDDLFKELWDFATRHGMTDIKIPLAK